MNNLEIGMFVEVIKHPTYWDYYKHIENQILEIIRFTKYRNLPVGIGHNEYLYNKGEQILFNDMVETINYEGE